MDDKTLRLFTSKGPGEDRIVSVRAANGFDLRILFELGMAIDGNSAVLRVDGASEPSVLDALLGVQRQIVEAIERQGYRVVFA